VIGWASRCETNAAKAKHDSGDSVSVAWGERVVKEDLSVVMRVNVDKSGRHDAIGGIDFLCTGFGDGSAHLSKDPIGDRDVADDAGGASSVNNESVSNHEICHGSPIRFGAATWATALWPQ